MSNPLENKQFKHYLRFLNDRDFTIEISEPVKFDASEFFLGQDDGYARDLSFMNEEIDLEFYKGFYNPTDTPYDLPNGTIVNYLSHGFEWLIEYDKLFGFEAQVEYILERNGVQFSLGELNFEGRKTDELTYFNCKVVQATKRALAKRREDTTIDGFATEDLDGNPISPLTTHDILLKAKPITSNSSWSCPNEIIDENLFAQEGGGIDNNYYYYNNCQTVVNYGIQNTLSFLSQLRTSLNSDTPSLAEQFPFLEAQDDLTDVEITIKDLEFSQNIDTDNGGDGFADNRFKIVWGEDIDNIDGEILVFSESVSDSDGSWSYSIEEETFTIPLLSRGKRLWIFFRTRVRQSSDIPFGNPRIEAFTSVSQYTIEIKAISTGIDTVIKGCRYYDVLNQSLKAINSNEVVAPEFQEGGEFYNLFCFSGNLIRQRDDVPFYFTYKDRRENLMFVNADCQVNETDAFALQYNKFYDNVDNGGFLLAPNEKFYSIYNEKYTVNTLEYKFSTYETDRDESNTLDAVHTDTQWQINNTKVENTKNIEVKDIFDPFAIESARQQTYKTTTALDNDNKIHVMDCVPLAPNAIGGFTASMTHNIDSNGRVQLLKDADLPSWALLGFGVGDSFEIVSDDNLGTYAVFEIEDNIITLTPVSPTTQSFTGTSITQVEYFYTNVQYTNRTNEGFDLIENVLSPDSYGNLRYTIRRNLVHWESYMRTCALYISDNIKNTKFINNGELVTQYNGGTTYTENADIVLSEIQDPILTPKIFDNDIIVDYDDALDLFEKYESIGTVGGFIRVMDNNGAIIKVYPKTMKYNWTTSVMNVMGEQRYESEVINITKDGSNIVINEVYYSQETLPDVFYEANGDYVVLFDENNVNLTNFTRYDKYVVQEGTFDNVVDLVQAIIDL